MKINIVYIVSTLKRAGPNHQLFNLINKLDKSIYEPVVITLSPEETDSIKYQFINAGIRVESLNLSRIKGLFYGKKRMLQYIQKLKPDLIHTQGIRSDYLSLCLPDQIKKVMTVRNYPQLDYPKSYGRIKGYWMYRMHARIMRKHPVVVGVSSAVSDNLRKKFDVYAKVVRNGVDTEKFCFTTTEKKVIARKTLNLSVDAKIFVSIGHLKKLKQPLLLINAFNNMKTKDPVILILIGDGTQRSECEKLAGNKPNIIFTGRINNVSDYLAAADIYVSASTGEGMPNAVLEALASGLPCILSGIKPHLEILEMEATAGMIFKTGDKVNLIHQMEDILSADRQKMSLKAVNLINKNLSAVIMSKKYQKLYKEVLHVK